MEASTVSFKTLAHTVKTFTRRLLIIGENRLELLAVEIQEERERFVRVIILAFGVAAFSLLAGLTLTAAIVVLLWPWCPVTSLLALSVLYGIAGICLYRRLFGLMNNWQRLSATLDQLRKDRECLEKILG